MKRLLIVLLLPLCNGMSCKEEAIVDPPPDPPGRQYDIPWPSLADSPWPMNRGNPQGTGRTNLSGPTMGEVVWETDLNYSEAGVAVGPDSTIYAVQVDGLLAFTHSGNVKWRFRFPSSDPVQTTPLVDNRGVIYFGTQSGKIFAVNQDSTQRWVFSSGGNINSQSLLVGLDGTIYFLSFPGELRALNPEGGEKWTFSDPRMNSDGDMTFSEDGLTLYLPGKGVGTLAFDVMSRSVKWTFGFATLQSLQPLVDNGGNIYLLAKADSASSSKPTLFCLAVDGSILWSYEHGNTFPPAAAGDPSMDANGNIYFAFDTLYSVDYRGQFRWKKALTGNLVSPLVCDSRGTVYLTTAHSLGTVSTRTSAFGSDGNLLWQITYQPSSWTGSSPAITWEKSLVNPSFRGQKLYGLR